MRLFSQELFVSSNCFLDAFKIFHNLSALRSDVDCRMSKRLSCTSIWPAPGWDIVEKNSIAV